MLEFLNQLNRETEVLMVLSMILFSGFIMTRLTNTLNLPKVSGYILAGILIGPFGLNLIPETISDAMGFVSDLALAFIAFGVGKFFKKEVLMKTGKKIIVITISEALVAGVLVTLSLKFLFQLSWEFALILGAIATATAPASTMMTINQYKAKGEFVNTLLQIVALDDVVCLLAFSVVSAVINGRAAGTLSVHDIAIPIIYNFLAIGLGIFCGYFLSRLLIPARSRDNRLILVIAMLLGLSGICAAVDISPLLSCMVFGAVYINLTRDKKLFRQINNFTPPVMSIFFIVSGLNLDISALSTVGVIGVTYFIIRIVGKYLGTYVSCLAMGTSREIRNYMGFALIPQAGVAIGLAFLGQRMLPPETGNFMLTIILSSSVLYEMVGPVSAKAALFLSGSIPYVGNQDGEERTAEEETGLEEETGAEEETGSEEGTRSGGETGSGEEIRSGGETGSREAIRSGGETGSGEEIRSGEETGSEEAIRSEKETGSVTVKEGDEEEEDACTYRGPAAAQAAAGQQDSGAGWSSIQESAGNQDSGKKKNTAKGQKSAKNRSATKTKAAAKTREAEKNRDNEWDQDNYSEEEDAIEEYAAILPELREYNEGVDERDDYDVERTIKPPKSKKKKKGKKQK